MNLMIRVSQKYQNPQCRMQKLMSSSTGKTFKVQSYPSKLCKYLFKRWAAFRISCPMRIIMEEFDEREKPVLEKSLILQLSP